MRDALCSCESRRDSATYVSKMIFQPVLWAHVLDMLCGSVYAIDEHAETRIWCRVLCGPAPFDALEDSDPIDYLTPLSEVMLWMSWKTPPCISKLWKLWRIEIWGKGSRALIREVAGYTYHRILYIIIRFLGPFADFHFVDGILWNRGWQYRQLGWSRQR